jgi:dihydroxyacetone kinase-like predicted kinase
MEEAAGRAASIEVTVAERDSEANGLRIRQGQALGLLDNEIVAVAETLIDAALGALARAEPDAREIVTIYWGPGTTREQARELCEVIQAAYGHLETEVVEGGQPHYPFIISVE